MLFCHSQGARTKKGDKNSQPLQEGSNRRTDGGRDRYRAVTCHLALSKPFLLLSILNLVAKCRITEDLIEASFKLVDRVHSTDEEVVITKNGRPAAVLVSSEEFESWKETIDNPSVEWMLRLICSVRELFRDFSLRFSPA